MAHSSSRAPRASGPVRIDGVRLRSLREVVESAPRLRDIATGGRLPETAHYIGELDHPHDVVRLRPPFYVLKPGDRPSRILEEHFPGLGDKVVRMWDDFGADPPAALGSAARVCLALFNLEGRLAQEDPLSGADVVAGLHMVTLGLDRLVWVAPDGIDPDVAALTPDDAWDMRGRRWVVVPVTLDDDHWILAIHDRHPERNHLYVMDPLGIGPDAQAVSRLYWRWFRGSRLVGLGAVSPTLVVPRQTRWRHDWASGLHAIDAARVFFRERSSPETWPVPDGDLDWANARFLDMWPHARRDKEDKLTAVYRRHIRSLLGSTTAGGVLRIGDIPTCRYDEAWALGPPLRDHAAYATNAGAALLTEAGYSACEYRLVRAGPREVPRLRRAAEPQDGDDVIRPDCVRGWCGWSFLVENRMMSRKYTRR